MGDGDGIDSPHQGEASVASSKHVARAGAAGAAAVAVLQLLQQTIGEFEPRPVVKVLVFAAVFFAGLWAQRLQARRAARAAAAARVDALCEILGVWPPEELPNADGLRLGIFPVRRDVDPEAPYVSRTIDDPLRAALLPRSVVLLYGPARSGKSRTALEAITAARPGALILAPRGAKALTALLALDPPIDLGLASTVVWLDGLERYAGTLDMLTIDRLMGLTHGSTVVITVREDDWLDLLTRSGDVGETARAVAARARAFELAAVLDTAELAHAERLYPQIHFAEGIGESLSARGTDPGPAPARSEYAREESDPVAPGRRDPQLVAPFVAALVAFVGMIGVWVIFGFSTPPPKTLGEQIGDIKRLGSRGGRHAIVFPVDLHGSGDMSEVVLLQDVPGAAGRKRSDELTIYDLHGSTLKRALRFVPRSDPQAVFQFRSSEDVDLDGAHEFIGGYGYARDGGQQLVPFAISWDDANERYRVESLGLGAPKLSRASGARTRTAYTHRVTFANTDHDGGSITDVPVQDFAVTPFPARLIAGYLLSPTAHGEGTPYEMHAWTFDSTHGKPHVTECHLTSITRAPVARVAEGRVAFKVLLGNWESKSQGKVCLPGPPPPVALGPPLVVPAAAVTAAGSQPTPVP